jgi:hypothetical protein
VPLPAVQLKLSDRLKPLKIIPIMHSSSDQARIDALCKQEQQTVTIDGGNTSSSQLSVLDAIERIPFSDGQANRIWSEEKLKGGAGKRKIAYQCNQPKCEHYDLTAQKARQHFVSRHVEEAGWLCPVEGCDHDHKHKRLDDLKTHHMVPTHMIKYAPTGDPDPPNLNGYIVIPDHQLFKFGRASLVYPGMLHGKPVSMAHILSPNSLVFRLLSRSLRRKRTIREPRIGKAVCEE